MEFEAKVIKVFDDQVVLDKTSFYARGGGQEPDHGSIAGFEVVDVDKHANIIVHKLKGGIPSEGDTVKCKVDVTRRSNITKNHTSTHIINTSARSVLGSWVWQHSAFKDDDHARLDITHHSSLNDEQVKQIEDGRLSIEEDDILANLKKTYPGRMKASINKIAAKIYKTVGVVTKYAYYQDSKINLWRENHASKWFEVAGKLDRNKKLFDKDMHGFTSKIGGLYRTWYLSLIHISEPTRRNAI